MRWTLTLICVSGLTLMHFASAQECAREPGLYSDFANTDFRLNHGMISGAQQGQLYPYEQQDPWLHGQSQRVPSYGGFRSFRPYNYRHVVPQAQIASNWGATNGMAYSHQFFNRYRGSYLNGQLHSQTAPALGEREVRTYPASGGREFPGAAPGNNPVHALGSPLNVHPPLTLPNVTVLQSPPQFNGGASSANAIRAASVSSSAPPRREQARPLVTPQ